MGGFRLQGPNYKIVSMPSSPRCRCNGFSAEIDEAVETLLVNKKDKWLDFSDLPQNLREDMAKTHLGIKSFAYEVIPINAYTRNISKERDDLLNNINYIVTESELLSNGSSLPAFKPSKCGGFLEFAKF